MHKYKPYIVALIVGFLVAGTSFAAPVYRIERTILPETDAFYELGTTTARWLNIFTKNLTAESTSIDVLTIDDIVSGNFNVVGDILWGDGSATSTLSNSATSTFQGGIDVPDLEITAGGLYVNAGDSTFDQNVYVSGNVGIGTASPQAKVQIQVDGATATALLIGNDDATANRYSEIRFIYGSDGTDARAYIRGRSVSPGNNHKSQLQFVTSQSDGSETVGVLIDETGNVGIGTTTPGTRLAVTGDGNIKGDFTVEGILKTGSFMATSTILSGAGATATPSYSFTSDSDTGITSGGADNMLSLITGGTVRQVIDKAGNVGIGTKSPSQILNLRGTSKDVIGTAITTGAGSFRSGWSASTDDSSYTLFAHDDGYGGVAAYAGKTVLQATGGALAFSAYEANNDIEFYAGDRVTPKMFIEGSSGNVGIGTGSPDAKLEVEGTTHTNLQIKTTNADQVPSLSLANDAKTWSINNRGDDSDKFVIRDESIGSPNQPRFTIDGNGNVGIGTTSPSDLLSIQGDVSFSEGENYRSFYWDATNGRLGLGTTTPAVTLGVTGGAIFTGDVTVEGKLNADGGIDPPYISFNCQTPDEIREFAKTLQGSEDIMVSCDPDTKELFRYVVSEDKFYPVGETEQGFNWAWLGLLGLIGLIPRRK